MIEVTSGQDVVFRLFKTVVGCRLPASLELTDSTLGGVAYIYDPVTVVELDRGYRIEQLIEAVPAQYVATVKDADGAVMYQEQLVVLAAP